MKEDELRKHATCASCGNRIGHTGLPIFWTIEVERLGLDADAMRRNAGLAMQMGSAVLANVMGPNEEMTVSIMDKVKLTLCEDCSCQPLVIAQLIDQHQRLNEAHNEGEN